MRKQYQLHRGILGEMVYQSQLAEQILATKRAKLYYANIEGRPGIAT